MSASELSVSLSFSEVAHEVVTTARLHGEPLGPEHQALVLPILADPRVGATMGGVATASDVAEELAAAAAKWERDGFGYWMFFETATGEPVARGGLARTEFDGCPEVEVGWTVASPRWGEGFATELGAASVEVAFESLGLPDVVAFTLPDNLASRRVMEKLGFAYEKTAPYKGYGDHVLYRRRAPDA
jgi:[ribosomal protein S5]-alanine N-acetyltransferase